jgi:hypothetical protein
MRPGRSRVSAVGRRAVVLVLGAAVLLSACGGISKSELEEEAQARGGGLGESLPLEALDVLEDELGQPAQFTGMYLDWENVSVTVLVPGSDDELDQYSYHATRGLSDPTPVTGVAPADELRPTLMTRDDLALEDLDEIIDDAVERADLEGGYADNVSINRLGSDRTDITVTVTSPRRSATVLYRGNGDFVEATTR